MSKPMKRRVLLVEDRPQDVRLTERALRKAGYTLEHVNPTKDIHEQGSNSKGITIQWDVAFDGKEALDRLQQVNGYSSYVLPDLILLDWMMPRIDGEGVLKAVRQDPSLRRIPIVVLTTSQSERDVRTASEEGCNAYLSKPVNPDMFQQTIDALGLFWLEHAILPR